MHLSIIAVFCGVQLAAASCAADNCLRAVIASAFPTIHGSADCSAYLVTTLTPAVSTVTATATASDTVTATSTASDTVTATTTALVTTTATGTTFVTSTVTDTTSVTSTATLASLALRQPSPSIPAYASSCSGAVRYSSACSCIGITATTVTLMASTTTVTSTLATSTTTTSVSVTAATITTTITDATSTLTTTATTETSTITTSTILPDAVSTVTDCPNSLPTFAIQVSAPGEPTDGLYIQAVTGDEPTFVTSLSQASPFFLDSNGILLINGGELFIFVEYAGFGPILSLPYDYPESDIGLLTCFISSGQLLCTVTANTFLSICEGYFSISDTPDSYCYTPVFKVVPLCISS